MLPIAMAGDGDGHRVPPQGLGHRPRGGGRADLARDPPIRRHRAIGEAGRHLEHAALELASGQPEVERPVEPRPPALEIVHQIAMEGLGLALVLDSLDAGKGSEPRGRGGPAQVLDHGHAQLRSREQDRPQRRGEHAEDDQPAAEIGQPRLELGARQRDVRGGRGRLAQLSEHRLDGTVARELAAAGRAEGDVGVDPRGGLRRGLAGRHGHQVGLDLSARGMGAAHRCGSMWGMASASSPRRIFLRAWKTCARALSKEQPRLSPIVS